MVETDKALQTLFTNALSDDRGVREAVRAMYGSLIDALPAIVYVVQAHPPYPPIYVSPFIESLGYSQDEWFEHPDLWIRLLHEEDRVRILRETESAMSAGRDTDYEYRVRARDGSIRWIHDRGRFVPDEQGEAICWQGVMFDITERRRAEEKLKQSQEWLAAIFDASQNGIVVEENEHIVFVNKRYLQMYGYQDAQEVIGQHVAHFQTPEDSERMVAYGKKRLLGEFAPTIYEFKGVSRDGEEMDFEASVSTFNSGGKTYIVTSQKDITERKFFEEQLRHSQKMEAVGQLAGGIAHDFNNLLTAINGYADLTLRHLNTSHLLHGYVDEIRKAGVRAAGLTRQLLAFSRKQILQPRILDLNEVIAQSINLLRPIIGEHVDLLTSFKPDLGKVKADPGQIEQVLVNLSVNARDAMPAGGKLIIKTTNVEMNAETARRYTSVKAGAHVLMSVTDTGHGMSEEIQQHIFEPFFTTKEVGKGTGLGLSTVYGVVKQSGGYISVESEAGVGTTFKIYLPCVDAAPNQQLEEVKAGHILPTGSETILLVEDEEMVRNLTREILNEAGYDVLEASRTAEAIRLCQQHREPIHLVLTDVVMPQVSGKELALTLTSIRPEMKVLYMSGYTDDAIVYHGVLEQGTAFLQKPFTAHELAQKIRAVLDAE